MLGQSIREQIQEVIRNNRAGGDRQAPGQALQVHRIKAQAVVRQFEDRPDKTQPVHVRVRAGTVSVYKVYFSQAQTNPYVDVWTTPDLDGSPHYRFFNPPTLAEDPKGDIEVDGKRYREDPLAAIAEVILGTKS